MAHVVRLALLCFVVLLPNSAAGQGIARSLDEFRLLVSPGDKVTVTDTAGRDASGRVLTLEPPAIRLRVDGKDREWLEADLATISERRQDSLANGALIGLACGVGLITIALVSAGVEEGDGGFAALAAAFYGG